MSGRQGLSQITTCISPEANCRWDGTLCRVIPSASRTLRFGPQQREQNSNASISYLSIHFVVGKKIVTNYPKRIVITLCHVIGLFYPSVSQPLRFWTTYQREHVYVFTAKSESNESI